MCLECKRINLDLDDAVELFLWVIPLAVIFCRVFYVGARPDVYFPIESWDDFVDVIAIWDGGITIIGGLVGGLIGAGIFAFRKRKKCNFGNIVDLIVVPVLTGQIIGQARQLRQSGSVRHPHHRSALSDFPLRGVDRPAAGRGARVQTHRGRQHSGLVRRHLLLRDGVESHRRGHLLCHMAQEQALSRHTRLLLLLLVFLGRAWLESLRIDAVPVTQVACIIVAPLALVLGVAYVLMCMTRQSFQTRQLGGEGGRPRRHGA